MNLILKQVKVKKNYLLRLVQLEAERDEAKKHGPWMTFSGMGYQLGIVLLSAAILAVSMPMFWGSIGVSIVAFILMSQGIWAWMPFI